MKVRRYAEGTKVAVEKSKVEIETLLRKHGASQFVQGWDDTRGSAFLAFSIYGRQLRYPVLRPTADDVGPLPKNLGHHKERRESWIENAIEAEWRRRWRSLLLILKAKLELVDGGDSTFDREFLADIVMPDGSTVGDTMVPRLEVAYETGEMPPLMLGPGT